MATLAPADCAPRAREEGIAARLCEVTVLAEAFQHVQAAAGAPGVDGIGVAEFAAGLDDRLGDVATAVGSGRYAAEPLLPVRVPQHGDPLGRELLVPTVRDRVLQRAVHDLVAPVAEERMLDVAHGYRRGRSVQRAVAAVRAAIIGRPWLADCDIRDFFPTVPHASVLDALEATVGDPDLPSLVEGWIAAPRLAGRAA